MNKIFTQIALGTALLFANVTNAQINQNFDGTLESCWITTNTTQFIERDKRTDAITSSYAGFLNNGTSELATPFIKVTSPLSISFEYRLSSNLQGNKTRSIQIGYENATGTFVSLTTSPIDVSSKNSTTFTLPNNTSIPEGSFRIAILGSGDGANDFVIIDNFTVSGGTFHYNNICNTAPIATDNITYANVSSTPFTGNFLKDGTPDTDNNQENITFVNFIQPNAAFGKVVFNSDSTFTFSPVTGFAGGPVTFQYIIKDDGYSNLFDTANVTITYPEFAVLPIHFMSFSGNANGNKAQLAWSVADNETGSHFEVEKSTDGKKYQSVATVMTSTNVGAEKYDYTDVTFATSGSFYRIKVINKDNSTSYSKTVFIKGTTKVDNKLTVMQNPVQTTLNFSFTSATDETAEVALYNLAGVKMHSQKVQARKGTNSISLGMDSKFNKGAYILTVQSAAASRSVQLIKQ